MREGESRRAERREREGSKRNGKGVEMGGKEGGKFHIIDLLLNADLKNLPDAIVRIQQKTPKS